jgi:hypothetical protein
MYHQVRTLHTTLPPYTTHLVLSIPIACFVFMLGGEFGVSSYFLLVIKD